MQSNLVRPWLNPDLRCYLIILSVYSLAWLFLLFNYDGIYWDDWVLFNQDPATVKKIFRLAGFPLTGDVHNFLLSIGNGVLPYRIVIFGSYVLIAFCVYYLMKKSGLVNRNGALVIALLVAVFPVNQARIALINAPSAYSLAFFFIAFVLSGFSTGPWRHAARVASLLLFFASFFVMSLLVFYLVPIAYMAMMDQSKWLAQNVKSTLSLLMKWMLGKLDYLVLPLVFIAVKLLFHTSSELYSSQYQITVSNLTRAIPYTLSVLDRYFWLPLDRALSELSIGYLLILMAIAGAHYLRSRARPENPDSASFTKNLLLLLIGIAVFYLGAYPYLVIDRYPELIDWYSRHQLLFPFGAALIMFALVKVVVQRKLQFLVFLVLIFCCVMRDAKDMLDYYVDSVKQDAIIYQLGKIEALRETSNVMVEFDDQTQWLNALDRRYRFYEFNGWMKLVYGDESRFGMYVGQSTLIQERLRLIPYREYNFSEFDPDKAEQIGKITIKLNTSRDYSRSKYKLKLVRAKLFRPTKYDEIRKNLIKLEYQPPDPQPSTATP